jgi:hypothetical protein
MLLLQENEHMSHPYHFYPISSCAKTVAENFVDGTIRCKKKKLEDEHNNKIDFRFFLLHYIIFLLKENLFNNITCIK